MESKRIAIQYYKSPLGELILGDFENQLVLCDWLHRKSRDKIDRRIQTALNAQYLEKETNTTQLAKGQLTEYFLKQRQQFNLNILTIGSNFQKQVWQALLSIPYRKTASYLDLAKSIENLAAIRAVAAANGANALSIIIPCHRIIGSDGKLVGYAGGLATKRKLLQLENPRNISNQLSLF